MEEETNHFSQLLTSPIVDGLTDLIPSHVGINEISFIYRSGRSQRQHYRAQGAQLVVQFSSLGHIFGLERNLKTATAHTKCHGIHINMSFLDCTVSDIIILRPEMEVIIHRRVVKRLRRVRVFEYGDIDLNLSTSSRADIGCQRRESNVRVCDFIWNKLRAQGPPGWRIVGLNIVIPCA